MQDCSKCVNLFNCIFDFNAELVKHVTAISNGISISDLVFQRLPLTDGSYKKSLKVLETNRQNVNI